MTEERIAQLEQMLERGTICKGHIAEMLGAIKQRTWVGLTFAEICECESEYANVFARNIEAKLKELNT